MNDDTEVLAGLPWFGSLLSLYIQLDLYRQEFLRNNIIFKSNLPRKPCFKCCDVLEMIDLDFALRLLGQWKKTWNRFYVVPTVFPASNDLDACLSRVKKPSPSVSSLR